MGGVQRMTVKYEFLELGNEALGCGSGFMKSRCRDAIFSAEFLMSEGNSVCRLFATQERTEAKHDDVLCPKQATRCSKTTNACRRLAGPIEREKGGG